MSEELERLAKEVWHTVLLQEAGASDPNPNTRLARFTALIAEECANLCEATTEQGAPDMYCETKGYASAAAIRAKFQIAE